jgi:hypothetical protein
MEEGEVALHLGVVCSQSAREGKVCVGECECECEGEGEGEGEGVYWIFGNDTE